MTRLSLDSGYPMQTLESESGSASLFLNLAPQAILLCVALLTFVVSDSARHWALPAVWLFGALALRELLLFPKLGFTDPRVVVGAIAFLSGFVAPVIELAIGEHAPGFWYRGDWRDWFGVLALIKLGGLLAYLLLQRLVFLRTAPVKWRWVADTRGGSLWNLALIAAILSIPLYYAFLIQSVAALARNPDEVAAGTGWINVLTDTVVILLLIRYMSKFSDAEVSTFSSFRSCAVLLAVFVAQFLVVGIRGSRSAVIWTVIGGLSIMEVRGKRVRPGVVLSMSIAMGVFAFGYGMFKENPQDVINVLSGRMSLDYVAQRSGRMNKLAFLSGDISRNDPQAFLLYRTMEHRTNVDLAYGRTYASAFFVAVPKNLWPDRPSWRRQYATNILAGRGTFDPDRRNSSRVYGLAGEALINWGPWGVIPCFALFGILVGYFRKKRNTLPENDVRKYWFALMLLIVANLYWSDMDNVVFAFIRNMLLISVVLLFSHRREESRQNWHGG